MQPKEFDLKLLYPAHRKHRHAKDMLAFTNRLLALEHFQNTSENYSLVLH